MGLGLLCALGLSIPSVLGKESFEQARRGKFTTLSTKYGLMSCRNGVAEIGGAVSYTHLTLPTKLEV